MALPLGVGDQLGDVIIAQAPAQPHWPRLGAIGLGGRRGEDFIQSDAQSGVDHFLEGLVQTGRPQPRFGGNIRVKRQSGSHAGIMMPFLVESMPGAKQAKLLGAVQLLAFQDAT